MEKQLHQIASLLSRLEWLPANYLTFMQEQILSHKALLREHNKAYISLKRLLASDLNQHSPSVIDSHLLEIMNTIHKASILNESLLNALTGLVHCSGCLKKPLGSH